MKPNKFKLKYSNIFWVMWNRLNLSFIRCQAKIPHWGPVTFWPRQQLKTASIRYSRLLATSSLCLSVFRIAFFLFFFRRYRASFLLIFLMFLMFPSKPSGSERFVLKRRLSWGLPFLLQNGRQLLFFDSASSVVLLLSANEKKKCWWFDGSTSREWDNLIQINNMA